ncbi:MAG: peptide chain release factor 2 [Alphaproteobacteria bacterium]|nr:peptide chain release factor 2 [Alphaproteobacteria bacterium]MBU0796540.1 peptide chain release factor 2 [Alphaproteobacteria bacterium]MBU0888290.1 peptide chain release factor 2 [Alphaproteobacteria bacterium]MBU1811491.1 peptide chain release factor 2 [Alphaproteobacteria bacterium]
MRAEIQAVADEIRDSLALLRRHLDWDQAVSRLDELNALTADPNLWNDSDKAQKLLRERNQLEKGIGGYRSIETELNDTLELIELGEAEGDADIVVEAEKTLAKLREIAAKKQLESLLSGEADSNDCYLEVNAGAGGTEAQDWALILSRMYTRWAEQHDYKVEWLEESAGEEAGLKSATLKIIGPNAYGWLKHESGVHRLVRISPFDSQARRHTSFASVWVYPVVDETIEVEYLDKDLRIDTYRASGAGGQHINKTDSAIRITHIPTGIVVQCQSDRSQHKNRATAFSMLKARLYELELQKREEVARAQEDSKTDIGWGHQIRSYVLQPYQMVKDMRTGMETGNSGAVLDGDIDRFLEASLAAKLGGDAGKAA